MDFSTEVRNRLSTVDIDEALLAYESVADEIAYRLYKLVPVAGKYLIDHHGDIRGIDEMRAFCTNSEQEVTEEIYYQLDNLVDNCLYSMYRHHLSEIKTIVEESFSDCKETNLIRAVFIFVKCLEDIHGREYIAQL